MSEPDIKKLAEFAGFKNLVYELGVWEFRWFYIDERGVRKELPRFLQSLDACFKWLVPPLWIKLNKAGESYKIQRLWEALEDSLLETREHYGKPALALCKAIEKLIDARSKG